MPIKSGITFYDKSKRNSRVLSHSSKYLSACICRVLKGRFELLDRYWVIKAKLYFGYMVILGIWSIFAGQNHGPCIRNPVYITYSRCPCLIPQPKEDADGARPAPESGDAIGIWGDRGDRDGEGEEERQQESEWGNIALCTMGIFDPSGRIILT